MHTISIADTDGVTLAEIVMSGTRDAAVMQLLLTYNKYVQKNDGRFYSIILFDNNADIVHELHVDADR